MRFDVARPIQGEGQRDEIFIVFFDGFIKNLSEGMIRTMLRDSDDWLEKYPHLIDFEDMTVEEIYDNTLIYPPFDLLKILCDEERDDDDIQKDLDAIMPAIFYGNSLNTVFEYALSVLLKEAFLKKCYLYKEGKFYDNELNFLRKRFYQFNSKLEYVDDVNFPDFIKAIKPTTIFLTDPAFVFDYLVNTMTDEEKDGKMFILLATYHILQYDEDTKIFVYTDEFQDLVKKVNDEDSCVVSGMFNLRIEEGDEK